MENNYTEIINAFFKDSGFVLIDFKQKGNKGNLILEVFVDKKENFNIDEIAQANKDLWKYLEEKNADKGVLKIIVSSPGAENPLKYFWQVEKHIGRELDIKMKSGEILTGKIVALSNTAKEEIDLQVKDKKEIKNIIILFGDISEVKIKLSFKK
jgi:ribosome maturation factor RimP